MDLKIKKNETEYHFIWRVYDYQKLTNQITQIQAGEICNKELRVDFDESRHRKIYESWLKVHTDVIEEYINDEEDLEILKKIQEKEDELYKKKVLAGDKIREHRNILRNGARFDNLQDTAIECANIMSKNYPYVYNTNVTEYSNDKVGVLLISDAHYGIVIDSFLNKYNKKIAQERFNKITKETIKFCKNNNIRNLKIINLQDLINGLIHVTTRIENEEDVITQIMEITEIMANMINQFSKHFNSIEYSDTLDNHSRVSPIKNLSLERENFGRLMSWYLKPRLENLSNVVINDERFDDTITKVDVLGETCFAVHGHLDNVNTIVQKLSLLTRIIPMSIFLGHIHHHYENDVMGVDVIVNGTISGVDSYAKEKRLNSKPMQKILIYERDENNKVYRSITKHIVF